MTKSWLELEAVDKAVQDTKRYHQPCWYSYCIALGHNLDERLNAFHTDRSRITVKTPAQSFRVTPINIQHK